MTDKIYGIMSAMPEEIIGIEALIENLQTVTFGKRKYNIGTINNKKVVLVFSRWGKVAAATTVTTLITRFGVTNLIFTGVAGAIDSKLNIGDIVLGTHFMQHDMDARPFIKQFELPLLNLTVIESSEDQNDIAIPAIQNMLEINNIIRLVGQEALDRFTINQPKLYTGLIASGDKFISSEMEKQNLSLAIPSILCVEMEGAAVAQVCYESEVPFTIIRTISDKSNDNAANDFPIFVNNIAAKYGLEIITKLFQVI